MRSIKFWLTIIISVIGTTVFAYHPSVSDSISFKTPFEEEILTNIDQHEALELLLAISEKATPEYVEKIKVDILAFKKVLHDKRFDKKSEAKRVKILFDLTHRTFFQKYREIASFDKIFDTKEYNCVSATALYGVIMKEYDIPFTIKETPTHVYSIAYPNTEGIVLESTAPQNGYFYTDENDIRKTVNALVESKYFTQEEVDVKGARTLYNEYFFSNDNISLQQLAGLQYHNESVSYLKDQQYVRALNSCRKLELLYPSEKSEYLKYIILSHLLHDADMDALEDIVYLTQYANLSIVDKDKITDVYRGIISEELFANSNVSFVSTGYDYLIANIEDATLREEITELYYVAMGGFYAQTSNFSESLKYAAKAYALNESNVNVQALIAKTIIQELANRTGSVSTIERMKGYAQQFPFLSQNSGYQSLYFFTCCYIAYNYYVADNIEQGLEYMKKAESIRKEWGDKLGFDENRYGLVYAEAGAAYFRKGKYKQAKNIIERGLNTMPGHPELKVRLEIVIDEMRKRGVQ